MFAKPALIVALSLLTAVSAHFDITYPPDRGENNLSQDEAPCGGLNTPSSERTLWPLTGGRVQFSARHDEAHTEVRLSLKENPQSDDDFTIVLVPIFNQVGLGTFCWNKLSISNGTEGIEDGVKATIQVKQAGHSSGWLYNCADITFTNDPPLLTTSCANDSGITAEPIEGSGSGAGALRSAVAGVIGNVGLVSILCALLLFM
ncbi:hypothetical protein BDZ91DRAFT_692294 [Kalaharituber pfeilii]|nr:hypothetical protein BDZ91DRAFT_692294 [Kalaharituber pfeilii]